MVESARYAAGMADSFESLKLEVGKRYVRRDGKVTDPLVPSSSIPGYPFEDPEKCLTYSEEGSHMIGLEKCEDLVEVYDWPDSQEGPDEINIGTVVIADHNGVIMGVWRVTAIYLGGEGEEDLVELERLGLEDNVAHGRSKVPRDLLRFNGWSVYP